MNEETLFRMIDDFARFPGALLGIFQGTELEMLRSRPSPERWSPLEILAHLRDEEKEDFRERARCAVEGRPIDKGIDPVGWVTSRQYNEMDPGAVFLDWSSERADSCRWLSTLTPEDLEKTVDHPRGGTMKAGDFITAWRVHDLLHLRQFATTMAQLWAARLAEYRADYAGDIPPA